MGNHYKSFSLDEKSDWITAGIVFDESHYVIDESVVNTRRFGTFPSEHIYADKKQPSKSIVKFDVKKFKLPLRFIDSE